MTVITGWGMNRYRFARRRTSLSKIESVVERASAQLLVTPMRVAFPRKREYSANSVGSDAGSAQEASVGRPSGHRRDHWDIPPLGTCQCNRRFEQLRFDGPSCFGETFRCAISCDHNLGISERSNNGSLSFSGARCWSNATIDMRGCCLRKGVVRMAGGETGGNACCAKHRRVSRILRKRRRGCRVVRIGGDRAHRSCKLSAFYLCSLLK